MDPCELNFFVLRSLFASAWKWEADDEHLIFHIFELLSNPQHPARIAELFNRKEIRRRSIPLLAMSLLLVAAAVEELKAAEATEDTTRKVPKSLGSLPVELKAQILSNLPVRAIVQARLVSRHFRDLIDGQENQT